MILRNSSSDDCEVIHEHLTTPNKNTSPRHTTPNFTTARSFTALTNRKTPLATYKKGHKSPNRPMLSLMQGGK